MLRIECPWCGLRDEPEFLCGGQSHIARPIPAEKVTDERWGDYLYFRDNPKDWHFERWCHTSGCGQWFNVVRHTLTHTIHGTYQMSEARPKVER